MTLVYVLNSMYIAMQIGPVNIDILKCEMFRSNCRKSDIMADAAYYILKQNSGNFTGNFAIDESLLRSVKVFQLI